MPRPDANLVLTGDQLAVISPYVREEVDAIKAVPGAKWDKLATAWRVPVGSLAEVMAYARRFNYTIHPDVWALDLPDRPFGAPRLFLDGKKITAEFAYDEVKVKAIRTVPGATWDGKKMVWRIPHSTLAQAVEWADEFKLEVEPSLRDEVAVTLAWRDSTRTLSSLTSLPTELELIGRIPEDMKLMPFQHVGVQYSIATKRCFIADEMGLGKTIQAIVALEQTNGWPAVVVCPPTLTLNWQYELERWITGIKVLRLSGKAKPAFIAQIRSVTGVQQMEWPASLSNKDDPEVIVGALAEADVVVIGYAVLKQWHELLHHWTKSVILDESQYIKGPKSQRSQAAVRLTQGWTIKEKDKKDILVPPIDGMILLLTGTPIENRPAEYVPQLDALGVLNEFGGQWGFYKRYCNAFRDSHGHWHFEGKSNLEELNDRLRALCYVRRKKEDVLPELDPIRHQVLYVEGDEAVMTKYWQAERDVATYMAEKAAEIARELGEDPRSAAVRARMKAKAAEHLVRFSATRELAGKAKIKAVEELVDEYIESDRKVVIAAHHRPVVDAFADLYGGYKIQGGQKVEEVELMKERFQNRDAREVPVMVVSLQAGKAGHTLTAAQDILLVELPWTPSDVDQMIARLHRMGQEGSVLATFVMIPNTVDEVIYDLLKKKRAVVQAATDGTTTEEEITTDVIGDFLMTYVDLGLDAGSAPND